MIVKRVGNHYWLTRQQFNARLNAGTLVVGANYHITDEEYIVTSDIVDNLTTNDATKVLSAKQGKALNDSKINTSNIIDNLTTNDATKVLSAKQGKVLNDGKINTSAIADNLTTDDATQVLSAKQGKALNDKIKVAQSFNSQNISGTPTSNAQQTWDSEGEYLYHLDIAITGITSTMIIENIVIPTALMEVIAPIVETGSNKITIYTKNATAISSTLFQLVVREV